MVVLFLLLANTCWVEVPLYRRASTLLSFPLSLYTHTHTHTSRQALAEWNIIKDSVVRATLADCER